MRLRSGVILEELGQVAVMRRERQGERVYYLFPGGGVEEGETPEEAAVREAYEELGLHVEVERLVAVAYLPGQEQYFFTARSIGGTFGTGPGSELKQPLDSPSGWYTPLLVPLADLAALDVRPEPLAHAIASGRLNTMSLPMRFEEEPRWLKGEGPLAE